MAGTKEQVQAVMVAGKLHESRACEPTRVGNNNFDQCLVHGGLWNEMGCERARIVVDAAMEALNG